MPRVAWTPADFLQFYGSQNNPGYTRAFREEFYLPTVAGLSWDQKIRDYLLTHFMGGAALTDRIFDFGGGDGFLIEVFEDAGYVNGYSIDKKADPDPRPGVVVIDTDFTGNAVQVRQAIRAAVNAKEGTNTDRAHWVITSSVLESYDLAPTNEIIPITNFMDGRRLPQVPQSNVIHLVQCVQDPLRPDRSIDPAFQQFTFAEWVALRPDQSWVDIGTNSFRHHVGGDPPP